MKGEQPSMNHSQKVVIVTGAANGIGQSIATHYVEQGAKVVLADIDEQAGTNLEAQLRKQGAEALFIQTDVRKESDLVQLVEITKQTFGSIHILINNAGKGVFKSPFELSVIEWDDIINTNLRSVFIASREAAKYMRENEAGGAIINIASTRALMSEINSEAYAASKGGIVAITHALAASLSENRITVNAISPGWIHTGDYFQLKEIDHQQHLSKRVGRPADIARACLFLTNDENDFVTGTNVIIDGGMTKKMIYEE